MFIRRNVVGVLSTLVALSLSLGVPLAANATPVQVTTIPTSTYSQWVAMSSDGTKLYNINYLGVLSVINTANNQVLSTTTIPNISTGVGLAVNPVSGLLYVLDSGGVTQANNEVVTVDVSGATPTVVNRLTVGWNSMSLAVSTDGSRLYLGNNYASDNSISVIDVSTTSASLVTSISPPTSVNGTFDAPRSMTVNGGTLYVGYYDDDASASTIPGLASFSTSTNSLINQIEFATTVHPYGVTTTSDGNALYMANYGNTSANTAWIEKFDLQAQPNFTSSTQTLTTGVKYPNAVALSSDNQTLYVSFGNGSGTPGAFRVYSTSNMSSPTSLVLTGGPTTYSIAPSKELGSHFAYVGTSANSAYLIGEYLSLYRQSLSGNTGTTLTSSPLTATGLPGTVTYSISPGLPTGFTFDTSTGVVSGSSTTATGPTTFTITGTDGSSSAIATVNLTVTAPGGSGGSGGSNSGLANTGSETTLPVALLGLMFLFAGISVYSGSIVAKNRRS